jgi:hypothetical protein
MNGLGGAKPVETLMHVTRRKHGIASVHPLRGPELRALRRLQRAYPDSAYVFVSEPRRRSAPMRCARLSVDPDAKPASSSRSIRTCCATPPATSWPTTGRTRGRSSIIWDTATFSIPPATPNWRQIGSRISGAISPTPNIAMARVCPLHPELHLPRRRTGHRPGCDRGGAGVGLTEFSGIWAYSP